MKNLLQAFKALQKHYFKILLINRKADAYFPLKVEDNEKKWDKMGKLTEFAKWFLRCGNIYEKDKPLFEKFIKECFVEGKNQFLFYRRKCDDEYHWAYIFIEPTENPEEEYLYVRDVNEIYVEQCDIVLDSVAYIDPLTSFGNHYAFHEEAKSSDDITYVTIKDLGAINAEAGYEAGDEILSRVAGIIEEYSTDNYRISGGTFALLNVPNKKALCNALHGLAEIK